MAARRLLSVCLITLLGELVYSQGGVPDGWLLRGSAPKDYWAGIDNTIRYDGNSSAFLLNVLHPMIVPRGFGTLMQAVKADQYRGKRLRLSCCLKSEGVKKSASLWVRVDGKKKPLAFDLGFTSVINGTTDWKRCEAVFDVHREALGIAFGVMLDGRGKVWVDEVKLEPVGDTIPTTAKTPPIPDGYEINLRSYADKPSNLDFEQ